MTINLHLILGLLLVFTKASHCFLSSPSKWNNVVLGQDTGPRQSLISKGSLWMVSSRSSDSSPQQTLDENEVMRNEIENLKLEALRRIDSLNSRIDVDLKNKELSSQMSGTGTTIIPSPSENLSSPGIVPLESVEKKEMLDDSVKKITTKEKKVVIKKDEAELLDGTFWKVALNIGREPGTWMPKTWGISGERLLINLDIEFLPVQLFERDEFLGRLAGSKVLRVKNNQLTLAPTLTEGTRNIRVKDGGWRVSKGEGPLGTDMLKFYVEIEEEVRHQGGDIYCPAGRIYCTCGHFPISSQDSGAKERYRKRLEGVVSKIERMNDQLESDTSLFSFNKIKLSKDIFQMKVEAQRLNERYNACRVMEPDIDLLKLSKDMSVGLTREGGVCCKVRKGVAIEYHILGRFSLASTNPPQRD